jgi:hypothetical protein
VPPALNAGWKWQLESDGVTRPVSGQAITVPVGTTLTITAHTIYGYVPDSVSFTFTGTAGTNAQSTDSTGLCYVAPLQCTVTNSTWTNEAGDRAPVLVENGLEFKGPGTVDAYIRAIGNAQGIHDIEYTIEPGETGQPAQVVVEINPHTLLTFLTLSANVPANTSGTINLMTLPIWSSTKILSGPGSLSEPITYSAIVNMFPDNTLDSAPSLHLLSGSTSADDSVISDVNSSCGDFNTKPTVAPVVTIATGACVLDTDTNTFDQRHVSITVDNSASTIAEAFTVPYFPQYDGTVAAGAVDTFQVADIWPAGGGYEVDIAGQKFNLTIAACPTEPTVVPTVTSKSTTDCTTDLVTTVTTTTTPTYTFDADSQSWVSGKATVTTTNSTAKATAQECPPPAGSIPGAGTDGGSIATHVSHALTSVGIMNPSGSGLSPLGIVVSVILSLLAAAAIAMGVTSRRRRRLVG